MSSIGSCHWRMHHGTASIATTIARLVQIIFFIVISLWVFGFLGGVGFSPTIKDPATGANDTSPIFNWHPLAMTFGFLVCMGEALLAYKAPLLNIPDRQHRKLYHFLLHTIAIISIGFGLAAAILSHTRKRPDPIPNLYSTHSWLGLFTITLVCVQYYIGFTAYLFPKWSLSKRQELGSYHMFAGLSTFVLGLSAIAVGLQEKSTFIQAFTKPGSLYGAILKIPAMLQILLALYAIAVMFHFKPKRSSAHSDGTIAIESTPLHSESI